MATPLYKAFRASGVKDPLATEAAACVPDEPATKSDVARVEVKIAELRTEVNVKISGMQTEVNAKLSDLRTEIVAAEERGTRRLMFASLVSAGLIISANVAMVTLILRAIGS